MYWVYWIWILGRTDLITMGNSGFGCVEYCGCFKTFHVLQKYIVDHCRYCSSKMLKVLWALPGVFGHGALTKPMPRLVSGSELSESFVS